MPDAAPRCAPGEPGPTIPVMKQTSILIDRNTGLHVGWYFWLRVLDEANRSARYGTPFALLLLEPVVAAGSPAKLFDEAAGRVARSIRGTDLAGLAGERRIGIVLPHQDATAAEAARRRIADRLRASPPGGVRWESRLLCYPGDGAEISHLVNGGQAGDASREAQDGLSA